jgi:hypothetical protein
MYNSQLSYDGAKHPQTKIYTKNEVRLVSRFKILAVPLKEEDETALLSVRIGGLSQHGGSVPVHITNSSKEASVFEFTADHNLRLYHSELLSGSVREVVGRQIVGNDIRYSGFEFGWSPTARLAKYLDPHAFLIDMQVGQHGYQLRTIVNASLSTDVVAVDQSQVVLLPVGDRVHDIDGDKTKEVNSYYRLEAVELE